MSRTNTRIQNFTRVTALADNDVIVIGPASGDRAKGITNEDFQNQFTRDTLLKTVTDGHVLADDDSGYFVMIDEAGTAVINVPDGLKTGHTVAFTNIGAGAINFNLTGSETARGQPLIATADGYGIAIKITATIWQLSER